MKASLVPRLPDLFNVHEKEGEPGMQCHVRDVGPYTRVGRVVDHENCAWAYFQVLQFDVDDAKPFKQV